MSTGKRPSGIGIMGYFGHNNVGDEAMLLCWVNTLRAMGSLDRSVAFTADPAMTWNTYRIRAVQNVIPTSYRGYLVGYLGRNRRNFAQALKAFRTCGALIVGGGSLFHDRPDTSKYLIELLQRIEAAKNRRQTLLLLGVGIGPIHRDESRRALKRILSRVDAIAVRDSLSRTTLDELGISGPEILTTADPAFLLDPPTKSELVELARRLCLLDDRRIKVAFCLRTADLRNGSFKAAMISLSRHVLDQLGGSIWILPMQTGGGEDDRIGAEDLARELDSPTNVCIISDVKGPLETMGLLSLMDFVVAEKLHAIVFAVQTHTPFLAISYAPKVRSFVSDMGHEDWCLDLVEVTHYLLQRRFTEIWTIRERIRSELETLSKLQRFAAAINVELLHRYLATPEG